MRFWLTNIRIRLLISGWSIPTIIAFLLQSKGIATFLCLSSSLPLGVVDLDRLLALLPAGASLCDRRRCLALDPGGGFEAEAGSEDSQGTGGVVLELPRSLLELRLKGIGLDPSVRIQSSGSRKKTGLRSLTFLSTLWVRLKRWLERL